MKKALIALGCVAAVAAGVAGYAVAASSSDPSASCDPPSYDGTNLTLHCVVPQAAGPTVTETATTTETTTETATVTQTVPGPTVTETQTVTVTTTPPPPPPPPPPTTTPPPPPGTFAPGEALNASNTGYPAGACPQLTPSGAVTYTASGTAANPIVISCVAYTGEVDVEGSYITIQNCTLTNGGLNSIGFLLNGNHDTVRNCTITSPAGQSMYEPVWIFKDGNTVDGVNISRGENALTTYGTHVTIENSWLHDAALGSNPGDHPDSIEVYGGGNVTILNNRIVEGCGPPSPTCSNSSNPGMFDSPINVAPYNSYTVHGLTIKGNFLDNGQGATLVNNQNPACAQGANNQTVQATDRCVTNVVVEDNAFGGHQCPASNQFCIGIFTDLENYEHRPFTQTDAAEAANPQDIEWPTTGPDVNRWEESADIETSSTPHDGDVVVGSPN